MVAAEVREAVEDARHARAAADRCNGYVGAAVLADLNRLPDRIRSAAAGPAAAQCLDALMLLDEQRHGIVDDSLARRRLTLSRIHGALGRLRRCTDPSELLARAPEELRETCGFTRVMVSRIQGSRWVPEMLSSEDPAYLPKASSPMSTR
ncbi:MAG: hypothetical protein ACT4QG_18840 [Sporichthyaceae bacterium]